MCDTIDYNLMMTRAVLRVVSEALGQVAEHGLPGNHHFVITFSTNNPKLIMPEWLRARHPESMTIILQNWFENLAVSDDGFSVTLSFDGQPQDLYIPFEAINAFVDPGANFALQIKEVPPLAAKDEESPVGAAPVKQIQAAQQIDEDKASDAEKDNIVCIDQFRRLRTE